jgi:hypothetical protein
MVKTLGFQHVGVVKDEYAVSKDGMKMSGILDLDTGMHGCRFSIGIRDIHDIACALAITVGYRVFVCENYGISGDFQPALTRPVHGLGRSFLKSLLDVTPEVGHDCTRGRR